jgi:hypothetical protein
MQVLAKSGQAPATDPFCAFLAFIEFPRGIDPR